MINSRQLYVEERDPQPLMPKREPKPAEPAPKYAVIRCEPKLYNTSTGQEQLTVSAVDADTAEVITYETVSGFNISSSMTVGAEGRVRAEAIAAGYTIKNDKR